MSVSYIPEKVKVRLWGKSGGRCHYCNKPLWLDSHTKIEFNAAYIAHIIADKPDGPRGDTVLSEQLKDEISNLMLMCDEHHRLIDREDVEGHSVAKLQEMKKAHEERMELLTSLSVDQQSNILLYGANIGKHAAPLSWSKAAAAMTPRYYPAEKQAIELGLQNSITEDNEDFFWDLEIKNLDGQFNQYVKPRLRNGSIEHLSVFALAPQPLLMYLGKLLSDIPQAEIFQRHREPPSWRWQEIPSENLEYRIGRSKQTEKTVAINLSLSATISNSRIFSVLGNETSIWTITVENPNNDFLKHPDQLSNFRKVFRKLLNEIKEQHGESTQIHLFPAVPVSVAVDIGRVWMPKADLPIIAYDQNPRKGFVRALTLDSTK